MKRKLFATILFLTLTFIFTVPAYAIQLPLTLSRRNAFPFPSDNITLVSFQANLRVRTGFTSINTSMVIRNDSLSEINLLMGIPSQFDSIVTVKQVSVVVEGQSQKVSIRRAAENPELPNIYTPPRWNTFSLKLSPGECKVIESAYTIDNKIDQFGLQTIYFPLSLLNVWKTPINYLQIVADLDFYPPYVFEPNPSILPLKYDGGGRLLWRFTDVKEPKDLLLYFNPVEISVVNYLKQEVRNNRDIKNIVTLFEKKDYDTAIDTITKYLEDNPSFELKTELEYMKALCHLALYQPGMALDIFNRIENAPGFGSQLSNTVRNKIIYDKVFLFSLMGKDEETYEYLKQVQPSLRNNTIFANWVEEEIKRLSPPSPTVPQETTTDTEQPENNEKEQSNSGKIIEYVEIFGYNIPIELLFVGILLIIIIIYIFRSKRRKNRRKYIFN